MDIMFLFTAVGLWAAMVALARGCERLQHRKVAP